MVDLRARLRAVEGDVELVPDRRTPPRGRVTDPRHLRWLDVHRLPSGMSSYARLRANAERMTLGHFSVLVASPDDLIAMKEAASRPQDRIDIAALETIKRLRDR